MNTFDTYHKWLGIPPDDQPPNHYRLLGIPLMTTDPDVIENAADQRMGHIRTFQAGKHARESQRLLNEIAQAKVCLLDPVRKAAYDQQLAVQDRPSDSAAAPIPLDTPAEQPETGGLDPEFAIAAPSLKSARTRGRKSSPVVELAKTAMGGLAGLAVGYLVLSYVIPESDFLQLFAPPAKPVAEMPSVAPVPEAELRQPAPSPVESSPEAVEVPENASIDRLPEEVSPESAAAPRESAATVDSVAPPSDPTAPAPSAEPVVDEAPQAEGLAVQYQQAIEQFEVRKARSLAGEIARLKQEDELQAQAEALALLLEHASNASQWKEVGESLLAVVETAIAAERRDFARHHQDVMLRTARKSGDSRLITNVTLSIIKINQQ